MRKSVSNDPALVAEILDKAEVLHLALADTDGPYCVAVNFVREDRTLYLHTGLKGRKAAALATGAALAFAVEIELEKKRGDKACGWGYRFRSVQGRGVPRFLEGADRRRALGLIMRKYAGSDDFPYDEKMLEQTGVVAIAVEAATARVKG